LVIFVSLSALDPPELYIYLRRCFSELESLSSLKHLFLSHNQLFEMPEGVFQLKRLETLDLFANNISVLPQASV
jgi:Leucine-rich repeat (LRR) protein